MATLIDDDYLDYLRKQTERNQKIVEHVYKSFEDDNVVISRKDERKECNNLLESKRKHAEKHKKIEEMVSKEENESLLQLREEHKKKIEKIREKRDRAQTEWYEMLDRLSSREEKVCINDEYRKILSESPKMTSASWGKKGEQNVDYHIKWLGNAYRSIEKDCLNNEKMTILLKKEDFIDEKQEFDHIVISAQGVYLIESKYYKGKITINSNGNWIRVEGENEVGIVSPVAQVDRHHALVSNILEDIVDEQDIHNIICLAHNSSVIEGEENCPIPIKKMDILVRYIKDIDTEAIQGKYDVEAVVERINQYKVK